jgi:hypothetical protein
MPSLMLGLVQPQLLVENQHARHALHIPFQAEDARVSGIFEGCYHPATRRSVSTASNPEFASLEWLD